MEAAVNQLSASAKTVIFLVVRKHPFKVWTMMVITRKIYIHLMTETFKKKIINYNFKISLDKLFCFSVKLSYNMKILPLNCVTIRRTIKPSFRSSLVILVIFFFISGDSENYFSCSSFWKYLLYFKL